MAVTPKARLLTARVAELEQKVDTLGGKLGPRDVIEAWLRRVADLVQAEAPRLYAELAAGNLSTPALAIGTAQVAVRSFQTRVADAAEPKETDHAS